MVEIRSFAHKHPCDEAREKEDGNGQMVSQKTQRAADPPWKAWSAGSSQTSTPVEACWLQDAEASTINRFNMEKQGSY
jgi:hypothetical protein